MDRELSPDTTLGPYRLLRFLGEGGMGRVWAALDLECNELVALKFIKRGTGSGEFERRLAREARAAMAVPHPHIRRVRNLVEIEGTQVLVLEYLVGETLQQRLARVQRVSLNELAEFLLPIISAVGKAHELGVIHRDLKPANIFLPSEMGGAVKVLDFGIAKIRSGMDGSSQQDSLSNRGLVGTPSYMSPEQLFGHEDLDHRTDIWSLGLIMYEALSGVLPTLGENSGQTLKNVLSPIRRLRDLVPHLPLDVDKMVMSMLAQKPQGRPKDLRPVEAMLMGYAFPTFRAPRAIHHKGKLANQRGMIERGNMTTTVPEIDEAFSSAVLEQKRARRRRSATLSIFGGLGLVASVAIVWVQSATHALDLDQRGVGKAIPIESAVVPVAESGTIRAPANHSSQAATPPPLVTPSESVESRPTPSAIQSPRQNAAPAPRTKHNPDQQRLMDDDEIDRSYRSMYSDGGTK